MVPYSTIQRDYINNTIFISTRPLADSNMAIIADSLIILCVTYSWLIHCGKDILIFTIFMRKQCTSQVWRTYKVGCCWDSLQLQFMYGEPGGCCLGQSTTPIWCMENLQGRLLQGSLQLQLIRICTGSRGSAESKGFYNLIL